MELSLQSLHPELPATVHHLWLALNSFMLQPWFYFVLWDLWLENHRTELCTDTTYKEFSSVRQHLWRTESMQRLIIPDGPVNELSLKGSAVLWLPSNSQWPTNDFLLFLPTCSTIPWGRGIGMKHSHILNLKLPSFQFFASVAWMMLNAFNLPVAGYLSLQEEKLSSAFPPQTSSQILLTAFIWSAGSGDWKNWSSAWEHLPPTYCNSVQELNLIYEA